MERNRLNFVAGRFVIKKNRTNSVLWWCARIGHLQDLTLLTFQRESSSFIVSFDLIIISNLTKRLKEQ